MASNPFLKPRSFYTRDMNPVSSYVQQMSLALSRTNNISIEEARRLVISVIKNKEYPGINDPVVEFFGRDANGDRIECTLTLSQYLDDVYKNRQVLAPTLTAYVHPSEDESIISKFIKVNVDLRSKAKKEGQKAEDEGNTELAFLKNTYQANKKENNNSMSGAFSTESSVFVNETGHNTLTSITRSMASVGNALNERIISGNRHYRNTTIAINNVLATVGSMDREAVKRALERFQLHTPTPEEVLSVLMHSLQYYVFDEKSKKDLLKLLKALEPQELAAVAYTQDLYHIRRFNPAFVRSFLSQLSAVDPEFRCENPIETIYASGELTINYAHQVLIYQVQGKGKDYHKPDVYPPELLQLLAGVCVNINQVIDRHRDFIDAFFLTKVLPCSTAYIQDMVRKTVVLSDTDSTMFSIDEWVIWYFGGLKFHQEAYAVAGAVMFLSTQCIAHCLAVLSANMGVAEEHMHVLSMKPEFLFVAFSQSPVSKHYFTAMLVKEGSVYKDIKMEIKGVHYKSSAQPVSIIEPAQKRMEEYIRTVMSGGKISIVKEIQDVIDLEKKIIASLRAGKSEYYKRLNVKESSAYRLGPKESNYAWYTCWTDVFEPKYGPIPPPPYDALKIPTILNTPSEWQQYLKNLPDQDLATRLKTWSEDHGKKVLKTFYISMDFVESSGMPEEIVDIIDYKRIVLDLTGIRRMMLASLGYICRDDFMLMEQ